MILIIGALIATIVILLRPTPRPAPSLAEAPENTSSSEKEPAAKNALDLAYIPGDFTAAVIVHPQRLLKSSLLAGLPKEELLAQATALLGIDPRKVERVVLLIEPFPGGNVAFFPAGIVRFNEDVDGKQVLTQALHGAREQKTKDKTYLQSTSPEYAMAKSPVCGYVADSRTVLVAPEPTLQKMLAATGAKSPLLDRLGGVDLDKDVVGLFVLDEGEGRRNGPTVRQALGEIAKQGKDGLPPPLAGATTLPDRLLSATVALNLTGDTLLQVDLEAKDAESATAVHDLAKAGLDFVKQLYPEFRKNFAGQLPPDAGQPILAVFDDVAAGLSTSKNERRVLLTLKTPQGLDKLPGALMAAFQKPPPRGARPQPAPMGTPPGPPAVRPPRKDLRTQMVDWIKANNAFGPEHKIVADIAKKVDALGDNQGFVMRLGPNLTKSRQQTYVIGWGSDLFAFGLTPAQAKLRPLAPAQMTYETVNQNADLGRVGEDYVLSDLNFDRADGVDVNQPVTGTVAVKVAKENEGYPSLRLTYITNNLRVTAYDHKIGQSLREKAPRLSFKFPETREHTGPLVMIVEVVSYGSTDRQGMPFVSSNAVAALVTVTGTPMARPR
jgi:hypothetical protein